MKKQIRKSSLQINKSTVAHLIQGQLRVGGTYTCHGHSCCPEPTQDPTYANTCANTCAYTCGFVCGEETIDPRRCLETIRTCPA
ncbi:hypothetical protein [Kordia sp.]|uniref:hypothetical protein n=1 Tax=Kordia sp. TaxID=1965332 RepID=UPI0025B9933D|nr:hypothetical protein [Kordia sp.]MCH2196228.1 hypothetical protein [Kordia sp.]